MPAIRTITKAARCIVPLLSRRRSRLPLRKREKGMAGARPASRALRQACQSAYDMSARTAVASGSPSSTANCRAMLWAWSKKATGRSGKGVSVQAKLNSPKPTPSHGCMPIIDSALAQMP